ncbi:MAG: hypothetical protein GXP63_01795 [DPANN group archaeon]|nr:hypothetical protein [DPANN group archaeon]
MDQPAKQQEIDEAYASAREELTALFLQKQEHGVPREEAEAWLKKRLIKAREHYYEESRQELRETAQKERTKKRFGRLFKFMERLRSQFE